MDKENIKFDDLIDEYINYLALGIANLINIFEPEAISIGGSLFGVIGMLIGLPLGPGASVFM